MPSTPEDSPDIAGPERPLRIAPARYVLASDATASLDRYLDRDTASAYVVGGDRAYAVARDDLDAALDRGGVDAEYAAFGGECCPAEIATHRSRIERTDPDVVIGVGGGKALDAAKLAADGRCPVAAVPTSPATCAAWTALSIVYEADGTYRSGVPLSRPPELVVADLDVLVDAPARLFANGVLDAAAKHFETRLVGDPERPANRWGVRHAADAYVEELRTCAKPAYEDVRAGKVTPVVEDAIETVLAGPGLSGGLLSDRSYVGFAHVLCYVLLDYGSVRSRSYHGERVGYGVAVLQALSDDAAADPAELLAWSRSLGAGLSLRDLGVDAGADAIDDIARDVDAKLGEDVLTVPASRTEIAAAIRRVERLAADAG